MGVLLLGAGQVQTPTDAFLTLSIALCFTFLAREGNEESKLTLAREVGRGWTQAGCTC